MNNYKAIIFDLGNVIFYCSFEATVKYWAQISSKSQEDIRRILEDEMHDKFEKALIKPDEFRAFVSQELTYNLTEKEFEEGWNAIYQETVPGIDNFLKVLRQTYKLIALTNSNETHAKVWKEKYKVTLGFFENIFSSHEIKTRKPEGPAYQICLDYLNINANEVLFLDDKAENIIGANSAGINGILVVSFDQMVIELENKGINFAND